MTAADVVPSLQRWGRVATIGKQVWKFVEAVEAKDAYTVVISLKSTHGLAPVRPGRAAGASIYPKESVEAAGTVSSRSSSAPVPFASSSTGPIATSSSPG